MRGKPGANQRAEAEEWEFHRGETKGSGSRVVVESRVKVRDPL
jgi:hypothetical protein